jgi:hypothetical protein
LYKYTNTIITIIEKESQVGSVAHIGEKRNEKYLNSSG